MKCILVSDLHSQPKTLIYLERILEKETSVDGIIISGDITIRSDRRFLERIFELIKTSGKDGFIIFGNSDNDDIHRLIKKSPYNIHLKKKMFMGWGIFGIGETEHLAQFDTRELKDTILVTHKPPLQKTLLKPLRNAPKFHISGHLHYLSKITKYFATTLINVPTLINGHYAIFEPEKGTVEFKKIK